MKSDKIIDNSVTVHSIINKHISAIGGEEKLKAVKSITDFVEYEKGWHKSITAYGKFTRNGMYDGHSSKFAFNGSTGYNEFDGKKLGNFDDETILLNKKNQPFAILKLHQNPNIKLGEMEVFKGKECYTIIEEYEFKKMSFVTKHYFDIVSGLWIGDETQTTGNNYNSTSYLYFDDYREVDGILFPFVQVGVSGNNSNTYRTKEIKLNEPLTDKDFE